MCSLLGGQGLRIILSTRWGDLFLYVKYKGNLTNEPRFKCKRKNGCELHLY